MKFRLTIVVVLLAAAVAYAQQASTAGRAGAAVQKQAQAAAEQAPPAPAAAAEKKDEAKPATRTVGKRDPFISPIAVRSGDASSSSAVACGTGKRCLQIDQLNLQGVVKSPNGNIAVVTNQARRAYFLRENDALFNGHVQRITAEGVVFLEQVTDRAGRQTMREVVKRVNPGPA